MPYDLKLLFIDSSKYVISDRKYAMSSRQHISPSFHELRHILNLAQVIAIGTDLSLISFDGDQTLYSDGGNFEDNAALAGSIIQLLRVGVAVAVITAAGTARNTFFSAIFVSLSSRYFLLCNAISNLPSPEASSSFHLYGADLMPSNYF